MKKTLKLRFWRQPHNVPNLFRNISSSLGRIMLHTENQPPSLCSSGDSHEEDLKIGIWKTNSKYFMFFSLYFFYLIQYQVTYWKSPFYSLLNSGDSNEEDLKLWFGRQPQNNSNCFLNICLIRLISSCIPKISLLACLVLKKTLKFVFGRRPYNIFEFFSQYFFQLGLKQAACQKSAS